MTDSAITGVPTRQSAAEAFTPTATAGGEAGRSEADPALISPTLIIGTGLVGASIGCALRNAGVEVHLQDKVRSHALVAVSRGAGSISPPDAGQVRLVVVAVPPAAIPSVVRAALQDYPQATVTDVGSVKSAIANELHRSHADPGSQPDISRYLGSHPMAGSQYTGPLTAIPELFVDRTWVLVPGEANESSRQRVRTLARLCRARVVEMDAATHDLAVAEVSHLPQLMSSLTAARLADAPPADLRLAGQGVRDVTRIAASEPAMWRQIITANADQISIQLRAVRDDLDALISGLTDPAIVTDLLERGRTGVAALPGKHGHGRRELVNVVVEIPDAPGALARLFADIQAQDINVEDLTIEHDPVREVGYLGVQVVPERAEPLRQAMRDAGWSLLG